MGKFPNPDTQFKPGRSGNPKGKAKGTIHLSTRIQQLLTDPNFEALVQDPKEGWKRQKGMAMDAIIGAQVTRAVQGDAKAAEWLGKFGYGTKIEVSGELDHSINVTIKKYGSGTSP